MELIHESAGKKLYRDGDKLIKSFDESYSKANILNEALNQARVEETSLNIPKILAVTVVDGRWAIVRELIEGETLESLMAKHPEKSYTLLYRLGPFCYRINNRSSLLGLRMAHGLHSGSFHL